MAEGASQTEAQKGCTAAVADVFGADPESPTVVQVANSLMYLMGYDGPLRNFEPQRAREEASRAVVRFLDAICAKGPLLFRLADLHWADDVVLALIDDILNRLSRSPFCLVAGARHLIDRALGAPQRPPQHRRRQPRPPRRHRRVPAARAPRRPPGPAPRPARHAAGAQRRQPVLPRGAGGAHRPRRRATGSRATGRVDVVGRRRGGAAGDPAGPRGGPPRPPPTRGARRRRGRRRGGAHRPALRARGDRRAHRLAPRPGGPRSTASSTGRSSS